MTSWVLRRQASRVVLLGPDKSVFLINAIDPADPTKEPWWEIPGGGMDPGESSAHCAERELYEEGGFEDVTIGPVVWAQHVYFSFGGYDFDSDEVIHVAWTTQTKLNSPKGLEYLEALAFKGARWWTVEEIEQSSSPFLPPLLPQLVRDLAEDRLPEIPIRLDHL